MRPKIGLTCGYRPNEKENDPYLVLSVAYVDAVRTAGGRPMILPHVTTSEEAAECAGDLDGLILVGGPDVVPSRYGRERHPKTDPMHARRDFVDFEYLRFADERDLPVLCICLGIQELNVHRGGTLYQHLPDDLAGEPPVVHVGDGVYHYHPVRVEPGSRLHGIVSGGTIEVNSWHHQGVRDVGRDLRPVAWSPDGLVEAVEDPARCFLVGVQWHPEDMPDREPHRAIFRAFVHAAEHHTRRQRAT
mgnify:CR=1 FL=1